MHTLAFESGSEKTFARGGRYSMCRARSMSVIYSQYGLLIIDVDHRCQSSIVDADRRSSMSKIDVEQCPSLNSRCGLSIVDVDHRSSMSVIEDRC